MYIVWMLLCVSLAQGIEVNHSYRNASCVANCSPRSNALYVAGLESIPFAYYDANEGHFKGIDVSLVRTVASKLGKSLLLHIVSVNESDSTGAKSIFGLLTNR